MTVNLLRHWESTFNKLWLIQWHSKESVLTDKWRKEVYNLVKIIKWKFFDNVIISDLPRTKETFDIICPYILFENCIYTPNIREQWQWLFEWKPYSDKDFILLKKHEYKEDEIYEEIASKYLVETINNFKTRINNFFWTVDFNKKNLCITHWWVIELFYKWQNAINWNIYLLNKFLWV